MTYSRGVSQPFLKSPESIYFRLHGPDNPLQLFNPAVGENNQTINKWVWLCTNKTFFIKRGGGPDLACGLQFAEP